MGRGSESRPNLTGSEPETVRLHQEALAALESWRQPLRFRDARSEAAYDVVWGLLANRIDAVLQEHGLYEPADFSVLMEKDAAEENVRNKKKKKPPQRLVNVEDVNNLAGWQDGIRQTLDPESSDILEPAYNSLLSKLRSEPAMAASLAEEGEQEYVRTIKIFISDTGARVDGSEKEISFIYNKTVDYSRERLWALEYFADNPQAVIKFGDLWTRVLGMALEPNKHQERIIFSWLAQFTVDDDDETRQLFKIENKENQPKEAEISLNSPFRIVLERPQAAEYATKTFEQKLAMFDLTPAELHRAGSYLFSNRMVNSASFKKGPEGQVGLELFYYYDSSARRLKEEDIRALEVYEEPVEIKAGESQESYENRRKRLAEASAEKLIKLIDDRKEFERFLEVMRPKPDEPIFGIYNFIQQFKESHPRYQLGRAFNLWMENHRNLRQVIRTTRSSRTYSL